MKKRQVKVGQAILVKNKVKVRLLTSCATIVTNNNFRMECKAKGNLFETSFEFAHENCNVSINSDLWHRRLGHLGRNGLINLGLTYSEKKCRVCGRGNEKIEIYFSCKIV
ncbi:hypothetical protein PR048_015642 [Dryococelus australis]|uniref:GAG-pre-integrase domain-containing protein n=1 Tax=Dryococelus australis TaxID=614101 RepID=A0ABQ9HHI7_9NEOP|nr:hypothetical protein PR048_015642 [Dryococelus australis]